VAAVSSPKSGSASKIVLSASVSERLVLVTTQYRGVFVGYATDTSGDRINLRDARMAIRWRTKRGLMELCEIGPPRDALISCRADIEIRAITGVFEVSDAAKAVWEAIQ